LEELLEDPNKTIDDILNCEHFLEELNKNHQKLIK